MSCHSALHHVASGATRAAQMKRTAIRALRKLWPVAVPDKKIITAKKGQTVLPLRGLCQLDCWSCGLTAAYSILDYYRPGQCSIRELRRYCDPDPDEGLGPSEISAALRRFGLKCRITRYLTKPRIDEAIRNGCPILVGVGREDYGEDGDHWMVAHGTGRGEVLLANNLKIHKASVWVDWSWLKSDLAPAGWGMVVSE